MSYNDAELPRITAEFLKQAEKADPLKIPLDNGVYRHVKVRLEYTWFDILTAPECLVFTGDMGTFVFRRQGDNDMFPMFRAPVGRPTYTNPDYWRQKLHAVDKDDGLTEFVPQLFMDAVGEYLADNPDLSGEQREELENMGWPENEQAAMATIYDILGNTEDFINDGVRYTYRYLWCLNAIVWTIGKYDETKETR